MLADLTHKKKTKALKMLRKFIHRGWLSAWLDEKNDKLYLTAEDYRAAQEDQPQPEPEKAPEQAGEVPLNLETTRRFAQVLEKEQELMEDERAVEELQHMQKTTESICAWLEAHPESLPKARRFAEYYIPTTLKLLHTYNDVQGQQGENAETIRRDIAELADKGLLKRVHGGAVTTSTLLSEPLFSVKSQMDIGLKDAIAQEAVKYVAPGDVIAIGGGTTAYVFAQHLLESQQSSGITILTNSIPVAELVQALESKDVEVIVTGGVTTRSNSLVGPIADKVVASLRVNTVFLGTHSVSIPRGFLMPNSLEAATDMAMMDIADRTIILTDHTKWSCTSLSLFARFDQVDTVITDDGLDPDSVSKTRDLVKELVLAHQAEPVQEGE